MYQKKEPISWSSDEEEEPNEPIRTRILRKGVGIIDMDYYEDDMVMYCPHCKEAGFKVKLGPRILMDGETRPPDYENWLSCPDCYEVVAAYVVEGDASVIKDEIPTVETPFENNIEIIGAVPKRTSRAGRIATARRRKQRYGRTADPDKEIAEVIRKHGSDNVRVIQ